MRRRIGREGARVSALVLSGLALSGCLVPHPRTEAGPGPRESVPRGEAAREPHVDASSGRIAAGPVLAGAGALAGASRDRRAASATRTPWVLRNLQSGLSFGEDRASAFRLASGIGSDRLADDRGSPRESAGQVYAAPRTSTTCKNEPLLESLRSSTLES